MSGRARLERTHLLNPDPVLPAFFSAVYISVSFSPGTLTFSFFLGKINCQCPARLMGSWAPCSLVSAPGAPRCCAHQGPEVFISSDWEIVGMGASLLPPDLRMERLAQ